MATDPRGIRNNNPGNIEYGPFAQARGATGSDGRFAIFPTAEAGVRAMFDLLNIYQDRHGLNTVAGMIGRWAPAGENNTSAYASRVAAAMGIDPNTPFSMSDPNLAASMINAMIEHENGIRNPFTDVVSRVTNGIPMPVPPMPVGGGSSDNQMGGNSSMLRQGSSGDRVRQLQQFLNDRGANIAVDGQFGPQTAAAVRNYQQQSGLQVDGIVGPQTFGQINADTQRAAQPNLTLRDRIERFMEARQNGARFQDAYNYASGRSPWNGNNQWGQNNPTLMAQVPQQRPQGPPMPMPVPRPAPIPTPRPTVPSIAPGPSTPNQFYNRPFSGDVAGALSGAPVQQPSFDAIDAFSAPQSLDPASVVRESEAPQSPAGVTRVGTTQDLSFPRSSPNMQNDAFSFAVGTPQGLPHNPSIPIPPTPSASRQFSAAVLGAPVAAPLTFAPTPTPMRTSVGVLADALGPSPVPLGAIQKIK